MSKTDHSAIQAAEAVMGVVGELSKRGGKDLGHAHGHFAQAGQMLVKGAAAVAPGAVAVVAAKTALLTAAASTAVAAAAPVLVLAGIGLGAYKLYKWLDD
jgi:hypothetical protein